MGLLRVRIDSLVLRVGNLALYLAVVGVCITYMVLYIGSIYSYYIFLLLLVLH